MIIDFLYTLIFVHLAIADLRISYVWGCYIYETNILYILNFSSRGAYRSQVQLLHSPSMKRRKEQQSLWLIRGKEIHNLSTAAVESPQPLTNNVEEQLSRKMVEEELQSGQSNRIQLEIQPEQSTAKLRSLKDKQNYCCNRYSLSWVRMLFWWSSR